MAPIRNQKSETRNQNGTGWFLTLELGWRSQSFKENALRLRTVAIFLLASDF
jgi:hypothetical protein